MNEKDESVILCGMRYAWGFCKGLLLLLLRVFLSFGRALISNLRRDNLIYCSMDVVRVTFCGCD